MIVRLRHRLAECAMSLRGDPLSSLMSGLAIALAVAAFVIVTSIADGMTRAVGRQFESLGTRTLTVSATSRARTPFRPGPRELALVRGIEGVTRAALSLQIAGGAGIVESGGRRQVAPIHAVSAEYFEIDRLSLARGARPDPLRREALIGAALARRLFGERDPLGRYLRINGHSFAVSGILPDSDQPGKFAATDEAVYIPLAAAALLPGSAQAQGRLVLEAADDASIEQVRAQTLQRLVEHGNGRHAPGDLQANGRSGLLEDSRRVVGQQARTASWIASLVMVIAGLGVMNMLFLAGDRRRAEIGLRRAVGASRGDIAMWMVGESLLLCALAIPIGLAIGRLAAEGVRIAFSLQTTPMLTPTSAVLAVIATVAIVLAFSLAPAWQAARTDPAVALRSE